VEPHVVNDEPHGLLQEREHRHEVERRAARGVASVASLPPISPGALTCMRTEKFSWDESLATVEYSVCVSTVIQTCRGD
jgi:hypothetical protein